MYNLDHRWEEAEGSGAISQDSTAVSPLLFHIYCGVYTADSFGIWTGGLTYPQERVALLVAVVTGGHHPNSVSVWSTDDSPCEAEHNPVIYATFKGLHVYTINHSMELISLTNWNSLLRGGALRVLHTHFRQTTQIYSENLLYGYYLA